jgi:hypothetical protein
MPQLLHTRLFRLDMKPISQGQSTHLYSRQRDIHVHLWSNRGCKLRTYELRVAVWRVLSMHGAATLPIQTRFLPSFTIFPSILLNFFASSPLNFSLRHSTRYLTGSQYTRCAIYVISLFLHPVFTNTILVESVDFFLNLDLRPPLTDRFSPLTIALVDNAQLLYLSALDRFFLLLGRRVRLPCWLGLWLDEKRVFAG